MKLSQIELEFFRSKCGALGEVPTDLQTMKRIYYTSQIGEMPLTEKVDQLEMIWLRKIVTDNAGTPTGFYKSDLLKQAVSALGLGSSAYESENYLRLYQAI